MKKIYLLLTALIVGISAKAADIHTFFIYNDTSGNEGTIIDWDGNTRSNAYVYGGSNGDNGGPKAMKLLGDGIYVYSFTNDFTTVILTPKADNWNRQTGNLKLNNGDFTVITSIWKDDNSANNTQSASVPSLYGTWAGTSAKTEKTFTYVSGTKYKTDIITMPAGSVSFQFRLNINSKNKEYYTGYNGTTFNSKDSKSVTFSNSSTNNLKVDLPEGSTFHFELDFATMQLTYVCDNYQVEAPKPTLTVNTPSVTNVSYTSATLNWGYTASNMSSEKFNVTYNLKSNGASVQTGSLLSNGTTTSGTYSLTNLNEGTAYTVDVTVTPVGGTVAAQTKTSTTFTTLSHPTLYLCYTQSGSWGSNNPPSYFAEATQSDGIYKWSVTLAPGDYFFLSEKTGGWNDISSSRWGPNQNDDYDVTGGDEDWNKNISLAKNERSFKMKSEVTTGTYQITVDYTGSTPKLTISKGEAINGNLSDPEIVRSDAKYNTSDTKKEFAFYTITITNIPSGANVYYTLDGTDPNSSSLRYREGHPFQASANSTVKALAIKGSDTSKIVEKDVTDNADVNYAWENVSDAERMHRLRIYVEAEPINGVNAVLTAKITDNGGATVNNSESAYSWAKYEDFDEFEAKNASSSMDLVELTDHAPSTTLEGNGWLDLADNDTDTHYARNFTPAFYRAYVHADQMPTNFTEDPNQPQHISMLAVNEPSWTTNENPAAGKVDPYATARVAYTQLIAGNLGNTTGVENVIVDENVGAEDVDAPVVFYNLNGVRVENPSNGIYIRVQGSKVTKEFIR